MRNNKIELFGANNMKRKRLLYAVFGALIGAAISSLAGNSTAFTAVCALAAGTAGLFLPPALIRRKHKKDLKLYEIDMADYLIGVSLLLSSGLTLWDSLRRGLYGMNLKKPLYRDLSKLFDGIDMGKYESPVEAFEEFAAWCGSPAVSTLTAVIVQNYKKGSGEVAALLSELSVTARNNRKYICMKLADEATTLLIIPSAMILIALVALLLTPAIVTLAGI
ncbi:MAG: hypothetical protein J5950_04645 [Clostridia bacterium]|nr:hypothetical protein [Clostridia bacterium]